ncbi:hypothetical protein ThidrDRAFT_1517 [Thiorhodococcus drewsii AZ1]|uniref:Uncharacterized protein n=1 Tax=Thiorhodococcus drewsii AZ1 TaxID=765913 RepID=G2DZQ4_9GAMM|nr:hypothetical protein [Thiorhodococcus drewsii]EGV32281.1 hypothetical protein ThidrDRAFT_1517 [Thiorhodococcus drewsii AZ1]
MGYERFFKTSMAAGLMALAMTTSGVQAASFGDYLKQLGAFSFGGTEFDSSDMDGNRKDWADRERWVKEALDKAYQALARSDQDVDLFDFQNYYNVLSIQWTPEYLTDPANIGNLNAYATFTEYLSRYLEVKQKLITKIAELNRHYAVLKQVDPRQLTGPFQLDTGGRVQSYTQQASGAVDATAHQAALATSAGAVEKYTAELNRAIDYGIKLERYFKQAAGIGPGT